MVDKYADVPSLCELRALSERSERARYTSLSLEEIFASVSSASSANSVSSAVDDWRSVQETFNAETSGDETLTGRVP